MVIADVRNIVLFWQLLFRIAQPCCMHHNSVFFHVISYKPEGKCAHDGRLPLVFFPQLGSLPMQNRSAVDHTISETLFKNGDSAKKKTFGIEDEKERGSSRITHL